MVHTLWVLAAVTAWVAVTMTAVFRLKHTVRLHASREAEMLCLDVTGHGPVSSYADFL